jgi:hypothetical protein
MIYFYKGIVDKEMVEVKIIQTINNRCEIIRLTQKSNGAGFWVNKCDLRIRHLLKVLTKEEVINGRSNAYKFLKL